MRMFSVFDVVAETYRPPFCVPNAGVAIRAFRDELVREGSEFSAHPKDYVLYLVGEFDPDSGEMSPLVRTVVYRGEELSTDSPGVGG